jgi:hypothetical protein
LEIYVAALNALRVEVTAARQPTGSTSSSSAAV